jgi:pilus assembly protein CpaE
VSARILVVDDSQVTALVAKTHLEALGYQVQIAPDGPAGLQMAAERAPDLVLLDVVLPGIDGFEVCRRMRKLSVTASVPIIMLTSKSSMADKQLGFEAGADDYLSKPVHAAELKMRVAAQLRRAARPSAEPAGAVSAGRLVAVYSLRGGSGCSSLAVNLAVSLSKLWGQRVPLLDLATPVGVCDSMLNLPAPNRLDTLASKQLDEIDADVVNAFLTDHNSGVRLLAGFDDPVFAEQLTDKLVTFLIEHLRHAHAHRYVVADLSHDLAPPTLAALDQADVIVLPLTPDLNSVRLASAALGVFKALGYDKNIVLVFNQTMARPGLSRAQIEKALGQPLPMQVPFSETALTNAMNVGVPLMSAAADEPLNNAIEDLAWRVSDPQMRQAKPAEPSPAWQRVAQRQRSKDAAK